MPFSKALKEWVSSAAAGLPLQPGWLFTAPATADLPLRLRATLSCQETKNSQVAAEATEIGLHGGVTIDGKRLFINKMDPTVNTLVKCE